MLTPKELTDKKFDKVVFGGYDMEAVDNFLTDVENDYSQLYKENATLKKSMKVLVSKVEEYRGMDDSMRKALASAQTMAAQIIDKAKVEALNIENAARTRGNELLSSYAERLAAEEMKLEEAKTNVQMFVERMLTMYAQATATLESVRETELNVDTMISGVLHSADAPAAAPKEIETPAYTAPDPLPSFLKPDPTPAAPVAEVKPTPVPVPPAPVPAPKPSAPAPVFTPTPVSASPAVPTGIADDDDEPEFIVPIEEPKIIRRPAPVPPTEKLERTAPIPAAHEALRGIKPVRVLPDTVRLPYIPPIPQDTGRVIARQPQQTPPAEGQARNMRVFERDITRNDEFPNSVKRTKDGDDDGETIILTPKPRFEFNDLQFGENYDKANGKKK